MSESITPTSGGEPTTSGTESTQSASSNPENWSSKTTISSIADLRKKAPKVYRAMMEGIAMQIINSMRRQQEHLKQIMREGRKQAGIR